MTSNNFYDVLNQYGKHLSHCRSWWTLVKHGLISKEDCTCGLYDILEKLKEEQLNDSIE